MQFQSVFENRIQYNLMKESVAGLIVKAKDIEKRIKVLTLSLDSQQHPGPDSQILLRLEDRIEKAIQLVVLCFGSQLESVKNKHESLQQFYESELRKQ